MVLNRNEYRRRMDGGGTGQIQLTPLFFIGIILLKLKNFMAAKKKEYVDVVLPTSGDGVDYEVISRKKIEDAHKKYPDVKSDPYDEFVEIRKKTCYGNPEEVFETFETVRYRKYRPAPEYPTEVKVKQDVKKEVTEKS